MKGGSDFAFKKTYDEKLCEIWLFFLRFKIVSYKKIPYKE